MKTINKILIYTASILTFVGAFNINKLNIKVNADTAPQFDLGNGVLVSENESFDFNNIIYKNYTFYGWSSEKLKVDNSYIVPKGEDNKYTYSDFENGKSYYAIYTNENNRFVYTSSLDLVGSETLDYINDFGINYVKDTNTLYLFGATIDCYADYAIRVSDGATISVFSDTYITTSSVSSSGIYCEGDLTIEASNKSLYVSSTSTSATDYGINCGGILTIDGIKLSVTSNSSTSSVGLNASDKIAFTNNAFVRLKNENGTSNLLASAASGFTLDDYYLTNASLSDDGKTITANDEAMDGIICQKTILVDDLKIKYSSQANMVNIPLEFIGVAAPTSVDVAIKNSSGNTIKQYSAVAVNQNEDDTYQISVDMANINTNKYTITITSDQASGSAGLLVGYGITYLNTNSSTSAPVDNTVYTSGRNASVLSGGGLEREGYTFNYWLSSTGSIYYEGEVINVSSNIIMTPVWKLTIKQQPNESNNYTILFDVDGSFTYTWYYIDNENPILVTGQETNKLTPSKGGSYYCQVTYDDNVTIQSDTFEVTSYQVSFDANGGHGECPNTLEVVKGGKATLDSFVNISYDNKVFKQWNTKADGTGVSYSLGDEIQTSSDITLYAIWGYSVNYSSMITNGTLPKDNKAYLENEKATLLEGTGFERTGYTFDYWIIDGVRYNPGDEITITGNVNATAVWKLLIKEQPSRENSYKVVLEGSGSFTYTWYKVQDGGDVLIENASSSSYAPSERGTYYCVVGYDNNYSVKTDTFTIIQYTLTYDANGGSSSSSLSQTVLESENIIKLSSGKEITKTGYYFTSWNTKADGSGTSYQGLERFTVTGDATLYAMWEAKTVIAIPSESTKSYYYTGEPLTYEIVANEAYTVSGNVETEMGNYKVIISLVDKEKTMWEDGTSENLQYDFIITKALDNKISNFTFASWTYGENPSTPKASASYGTITYSYAVEDSDIYVSTMPTNAGKYKIKASVEATEVYNGCEGVLHFEIYKATYNMDKIDFNNVFVTYDGELKKIQISGNLPEGVSVKYYNSDGSLFGGERNVGSYLIVAKFTVEDETNYNLIQDMQASLIINPLEIKKPIASVNSFVFDETTHHLALEQSDYYTITNNILFDVGEVVVSVSLNDKVNTLWSDSTNADLTFTLIVTKGTLDTSKLKFNDVDALYDGKNKLVGVEGTIPSSIQIEYSVNGQIVTQLSSIGTYEVTAHFVTNNNYYDVEDMHATITIRQKDVESNDKDEMVKISSSKGFNQSISLDVTIYNDADPITLYQEGKIDSDYSFIADYETIVSIYHLTFSNSASLVPEGSKITYKINVSDVNEKANVIILVNKNGHKEIAFNKAKIDSEGYYTFECDDIYEVCLAYSLHPVVEGGSNYLPLWIMLAIYLIFTAVWMFVLKNYTLDLVVILMDVISLIITLVFGIMGLVAGEGAAVVLFIINLVCIAGISTLFALGHKIFKRKDL